MTRRVPISRGFRRIRFGSASAGVISRTLLAQLPLLPAPRSGRVGEPQPASGSASLAASAARSSAGVSLVMASSPSGSSPASSAGWLMVPVLTLSPDARKVPTSAGERRKCSTQTPCSPAVCAQLASASMR